MATPTRQNVSTPKSHLSNTPGRPMASPRPGTGNTAQKSLAYKSPAVKTPASGHGHTHNVSVSSHPSSTPLGQSAIRDELLNLDSPAAALINSIASVQDGLGISGTPQAGSARDGRPARSPEAERLLRLQQVVNSLKAKLVGRGITREGVERVARNQGFEALWDEDNLTVAGNVVELEINFDPLAKEKVTDLVLKLNTADGESHTQQEATTVLKGDFGLDAESASALPVEDLGGFSLNIQYLAQMDRINTTPDAFEIAGSLYKTFRSIWDEEKTRMKWRHDTHHLCRGSVGRPTLDRKPRLGICLDYWRDRHAAMPEGFDEHASEPPSDVKRARVSFGSGNPPISSSLNWLSPKILEDVQPENVLDSGNHLQQPAWVEPPHVADTASQPMQGDPKSFDAHFLCAMDPVILVPFNTALRMNAEYDAVELDQANAVTYSKALQNARNRMLMDTEADTIDSRWSRRLSVRSGESKMHSYALYPAAQGTELWFYPISQVKFTHPRQLADILPVARQYAVLWALLRNLVTEPAPASQPMLPTTLPDKRRVTKRSNAKPASPDSVNGTRSSSQGNTLSIDISLDVMSDPMVCKLEIFAPLPDMSAARKGSSFVHLSLLVMLDGTINVSELSGISDKDTSSLRDKLSKMLSVTEDIGMVLEWLVERERSEGHP